MGEKQIIEASIISMRQNLDQNLIYFCSIFTQIRQEEWLMF